MNKKVVFLLLAVLLIIPTEGFTTAFNRELYSLKQELRTVPVGERLDFLNLYCRKHIENENYREFLRLYEEEAFHSEDYTHLAKALILLGRHFYPDQLDSVNVIKKRLEQFIDQTEEQDGYVDIWGLINYGMAWEGKSDEMEQSVNALKSYSEKTQNTKGAEVADLNMGYFYVLNNMPYDAEKIYLDVLDRKKKRNAPIIEQVSVLVQLFSYMPKVEEREKYLQQAEACIELFKKDENAKEEDIFLMKNHEFSIYWTYASALIEEGRYDEALEHIKLLENIYPLHNQDDDKLISLYQLYYNYYFKQKQFNKALYYAEQMAIPIDRGNNKNNVVFYLHKKVDAYTGLGDYAKASALQKEIIELNDSLYQADFQHRIADVRAKYEVERLEFEKQQMEKESERTHKFLLLMIIGCAVLLITVFGLIYLIGLVRKSQRAYKEAKEKAENADRMKSAFLANMNHEIRTPLNAIVGFSQLIIEEEDPENKHEFAQIIENNNELLQRLIGDVLDISKIESNSMSLIYKDHEISGIMKELYNSISLRMPETVKLLLDPCESLTIETDRNRLVQVITNLLTNAIKHTKEGHIRFGLKREGSNMLYFYVEDTGEGIPTEQLNSIFDRFVQLENGTKGVGLGLAISKGLITKMGGTIGVTSEYGKGSTFYFIIPIRKQQS